jgi:hypothetical protein
MSCVLQTIYEFCSGGTIAKSRAISICCPPRFDFIPVETQVFAEPMEWHGILAAFAGTLIDESWRDFQPLGYFRPRKDYWFKYGHND